MHLQIKVHASSINPADWKSADGEQALLLKFMWPRVYGFDFSGEVIEVGKEEGIQTNEGKAKADAEAMTTDTDTDASGDAKAETEETNEFQIGDHVFGMIKGLPQRDRGTWYVELRCTRVSFICMKQLTVCLVGTNVDTCTQLGSLVF